MFEGIKKKYAHFVVRRKYLRKDTRPVLYNKILSGATDLLLIMPKDDKDFYHCHDILRYFLIHKKIITLFLPEYKYNLIPEKDKYKCISYMPVNINKIFLPTHHLIERLKNKEFDAVIDLNRNEDVFFSAVSNLVRSKVRVSFNKELSSNYYNMLISEKNEEPEAAYRSFLNYLKMF